MHLPAALRRPDWLNELHGLLLIAAVVSGIGIAANMATMLAGRPVDVEVSGDHLLRPDALLDAPPGVRLDPDVHLQVDHPSAVQVGWSALATLPSYALIATLLVVLWRLTGRARRTDPFTDGVVRRLRTVGLLLVLGGPAVWLVEFVARFALSGTVTGGDQSAQLDFSVPLAWLLCGFGIFAIGEIIRRGQTLRAELDGVV